MRAPKSVLDRPAAAPVSALVAAAVIAALGLHGCSVEVQNVQPARELAQQSKPPGSVYTGWRIFQQRCASCHGPAATGAPGGPDLLPRVAQMGPRSFVSLVLERYDWGLPPLRGSADAAAREARIDEVLQGRSGALTMPAWQGEPGVNGHILDLYAYVSARAQGLQGPGRPAP